MIDLLKTSGTWADKTLGLMIQVARTLGGWTGKIIGLTMFMGGMAGLCYLAGYGLEPARIFGFPIFVLCVLAAIVFVAGSDP